MVVLYRSGGLPTVADLGCSSAGLFDGLSENFLVSGSHVPRSGSVFMALTVEDALVWAEGRVLLGLDATIWEVVLPDDVEVNAYRVKFYDAVASHFRLADVVGLDATFDVAWYVGAYWLSGVDVGHWWDMYVCLMEGYDFSEEWEVKVPLNVAAVSSWSVVMNDAEVAGQCNVSERMWG